MNTPGIPSVRYEAYRPNIQTGDVLLLRGSRFLGGITRLVTHSDYAHVGLTWRYGNHIYMPEAEPLRGVRLSQVSKHLPGRLIHMDLPQASDRDKDNMFSVMGALYDVEDAIRAGMGLKPVNPGRFQCAEYVIRYFSAHYGDQPKTFTPQGILDWAYIRGLRMVDLVP